jgi:4-hydroxythreonine-4-phosphate dehydrogenase
MTFEDGSRIAITMGDPSGIGPEIILKALADPAVPADLSVVIVGDLAHLRKTAQRHRIPLDLEQVELGNRPGSGVGVVNAAHVPADLPDGEASAAGGEAAWSCIDAATRLVLAGHADVLVTAPINKYSLQLAGRGHEGHTELLMEMTGSPWSLTVFVLDRLRVAYFSRHLSLRDAIDAITAPAVCLQLERLAAAAPLLGLRDPSIAVAALNPHAGEQGLFGDEEQVHLIPAIEQMRAAGLRIEGPIPADAVFHQARNGRYDLVLGLYHDQVAAVMKTVDFHRVVSVTLGLPFLRLSVDHGTAFDIAGRGIADHRNMVETLVRAHSTPPATGADRSEAGA